MASDAREIRRQREALRQQWMPERAAEMDHQAVVKELTETSQPSSTQQPSSAADAPTTHDHEPGQPKPDGVIQ